jgi:hypothetical protein
MPGFHYRYRYIGNTDLVKVEVKTRIAVDLVEIMDGKEITGTFKLKNIIGPEYRGDVFLSS